MSSPRAITAAPVHGCLTGIAPFAAGNQQSVPPNHIKSELRDTERLHPFILVSLPLLLSSMTPLNVPRPS